MDKELSVSIPQVWIKNLSIGAGSISPPLYEILPKAFALVKSGRARLDWLVTSQIGIEDAPEAYERFDKKLEIKVVIRFPWARDQARASFEAGKLAADVKAVGEGPEGKEKRPFKLPA